LNHPEWPSVFELWRGTAPWYMTEWFWQTALHGVLLAMLYRMPRLGSRVPKVSDE